MSYAMGMGWGVTFGACKMMLDLAAVDSGMHIFPPALRKVQCQCAFP